MDEFNILYIVGVIIAFLVGVYVARYIFKINTLVSYQKAQSQILLEIAKKQGVDTTRLEVIVKELKNKTESKS